MVMSLQKAKNLRKNMTDAEKLFWYKVRDRRLAGYKFKRQVPVGPYIVDFSCLDYKVVVEIDGGQHNDNSADIIRDQFLQDSGFKVLRYWNNEILNNIDGVLEALILILNKRDKR
jgi:very-short-patch-repair endonuclease